MDEINKIRKAFFTYGESKNAIAKRFNRSWETIHRIVTMDRDVLMNRGKRPKRRGKVITPEVIQAIQKFLEEEIDKKVKKKQRYTARVIYRELKKRGIYHGSERRIQETVKRLREEHNQSKKQSYLPLSFPLGSALQIDHGEVDVNIDGDRFTGYLFVASVPGEVMRYCQLFPTKSQEAWGEFHERAFRFFGGIFTRVIYDNDSVLVKEIIGSERRQTNFSLSLEEQFGFESHFCNVASGNEKGAVENAVGYCRRNFLAGMPTFNNWEVGNLYLQTSCIQDITETKHYKTNNPILTVFKSLEEKLNPLSPKMSWNKSFDCRVDSCQLISIAHHQYSVPEKYIGTYVRVTLEVFQVKIFKDQELIAIHERQYGDSDSLKLDHYLDQLKYKANAFWDCKAVQNHEFDKRYLEIWRRLSEKHEAKEANREFVKTLLLGRRYSQEKILNAIEIALKYGAIDHTTVENIIKQQEGHCLILNENEMKRELNPTQRFTWDFDLAPYAELCEGVLS